MWKNRNHYVIDISERLELNHKIEMAYKARKQFFNIQPIGDFETYKEFVQAPDVACMSYCFITREFSFYCGHYWYEETNVLPVIAMAHELGHYEDITKNFNGNMDMYHRTLGTRELETRAWLYAIEILKTIGFKHWDAVYGYAKDCLATYFNHFNDWADRRFGYVGGHETLEHSIMRIKESIGVEVKERAIVREVSLETASELLDKIMKKLGMK